MARGGIGVVMAPGVATAGAAVMDGMVIIIAADTVVAIWVDIVADIWVGTMEAIWAATPVDIQEAIPAVTRAVTATTKPNKRSTHGTPARSFASAGDKAVGDTQYSIAKTSIGSIPFGVRTSTTSPISALSSARAIGEIQLISLFSARTSSTPTMRTDFSSPRLLR